MMKILRHFRDQGVDVTSEGSTFLRPDAFVGLQPMAWDYHAPAANIPPGLYCGTPMRAEPEIKRDPVQLAGLLEQFCTRVVPWYYDNNTTAAKGPQRLRDGGDLFVPALWRRQMVVAYSPHGYTSKSWQLPPGWESVKKVVVSEISVEQPQRLREIDVRHGAVNLGLRPGQGVTITP
jgi:hypothetical protein